MINHHIAVKNCKNDVDGFLHLAFARCTITALLERADIALNILDKLMKQFLKPILSFIPVTKFSVTYGIKQQETRKQKLRLQQQQRNFNYWTNYIILFFILGKQHCVQERGSVE